MKTSGSQKKFSWNLEGSFFFAVREAGFWDNLPTSTAEPKKPQEKNQPRPNVVLLAGLVLFYDIDFVATETAEDLSL